MASGGCSVTPGCALSDLCSLELGMLGLARGADELEFFNGAVALKTYLFILSFLINNTINLNFERKK